MEAQCVFRKLGTECVCIIYMNFRLQRVNNFEQLNYNLLSSSWYAWLICRVCWMLNGTVLLWVKNTEGCGRKSHPVNMVMHVQVVWEVESVLGNWGKSSCTRRTLLRWFDWLVGWFNYFDGNWSCMSAVAVVAVSWRDTGKALKIKASDNPVSITPGYLLNANLECCCYHQPSLFIGRDSAIPSHPQKTQKWVWLQIFCCLSVWWVWNEIHVWTRWMTWIWRE